MLLRCVHYPYLDIRVNREVKIKVRIWVSLPMIDVLLVEMAKECHLAKSPDMDYCVRMNETLLSFVLRNLESNKGRLREIAAESGVPYSTISKINQGITPNPGVNTVQALADFFASKKAA